VWQTDQQLMLFQVKQQRELGLYFGKSKPWKFLGKSIVVVVMSDQLLIKNNNKFQLSLNSDYLMDL
jgi:hypothetical protein